MNGIDSSHDAHDYSDHLMITLINVTKNAINDNVDTKSVLLSHIAALAFVIKSYTPPHLRQKIIHESCTLLDDAVQYTERRRQQ